MYRLAALTLFSLLVRATFAQLPAATAPSPPASTKPAEADPLNRDTPRGCVLGFLKAAERGNYERAAQYLDLQAPPSREQELARQLQVVLNRLSGDLDALARTPEGDVGDGLPENRDRVGFVDTPSGRLDILLDRVKRGTGPPIWLFSADTLRGVPEAFAEISAPGIERFLPRPLKEVRLFSAPLWRWLAILVALSFASVVALLVTRGLIPVFRPLIRSMTGHHDDQRVHSLRWPLRLMVLALVIQITAHFSVSLLAREFWIQVSKLFAVAGFAWLAVQFIDVVADLRSRQLLRKDAMYKMAVVALIRRLFKILVVFIAFLMLLKGAGVDVTAMLAGLGVGGIALALAAQKTLEDLFAGIAIISREAVRVGDFCKVADQMGTIVDVGLGSTRIRTLDRSMVSIPNSKISQMSLENLSLRDKIWFHHLFGLRYDTSPEQMRYVLAQVGEMMRGHRKIEKESARIRFISFGSSSLDLEVFAYILERDYASFLEVQEDVLLRIMDIVIASGTRIALPSQLNFLDRDRGASGGEEIQSAREQHHLPLDEAVSRAHKAGIT
ncbi:MAG: mechanosensitive ion channel family protein [Acidobacteriaceae bacterium]|nr:mechanosensitive ion channel family protein [Acidobacteriaceae bacterium]